MKAETPHIVTGVVDRVFRFSIVVFLLLLLHNHVQLVLYPETIDINEGLQLSSTELFSSGSSPYSFAAQPARMNVYTPLYNITVAPLSLMFGNTLVLHRIVNGVFICVAALLCFAAARKAGGSRAYSFAAATLVYAGFLYFSTPISSPNGIGLTLFFLTIFAPWYYHFSRTSLVLALLLGLLAFFAKQYFLVALAYVAFYTFLNIAKSRGVFFGLSCAVAFILCLVVASHYWPYFLDHTLLGGSTVEKILLRWSTLWTQIIEYTVLQVPLILMAIVCLVGFLSERSRPAALSEKNTRRQGSNQKRLSVNISDFGAPFLHNQINYIWVCSAISLLTIVAVLGRNPGNHLTYFFQILSPFLLIGMFVLVSRASRYQWLLQLLTLVLFYKHYSILSHDFSVDAQSWSKIRGHLSTADEVYATSWLDPELIATGKTLHKNGATPYFLLSADKPGAFVKDSLEMQSATIWKHYVEDIYSKVRNKEFDLIVLDDWSTLPPEALGRPNPGKALLAEHYDLVDTVRISMINRKSGGKWNFAVWKPKPASNSSN